MEVGIPPSLVPCQAIIESGKLENGQTVVQIALATPTGVHVTFWDPASAQTIAQRIHEVSRQVRGQQLIVPSTDKVVDINKKAKEDGKGTEE